MLLIQVYAASGFELLSCIQFYLGRISAKKAFTPQVQEAVKRIRAEGNNTLTGVVKAKMMGVLVNGGQGHI